MRGGKEGEGWGRWGVSSVGPGNQTIGGHHWYNLQREEIILDYQVSQPASQPVIRWRQKAIRDWPSESQASTLPPSPFIRRSVPTAGLWDGETQPWLVDVLELVLLFCLFVSRLSPPPLSTCWPRLAPAGQLTSLAIPVCPGSVRDNGDSNSLQRAVWRVNNPLQQPHTTPPTTNHQPAQAKY